MIAKSFWAELLKLLPRVDLVTCQLTRAEWRHYIASQDGELPLLVLRYLHMQSDSPDCVEVRYSTEMYCRRHSLRFLNVSDASQWLSSFVKGVYIRQLAVKGYASPVAVYNALLEAAGVLKVDAIGISTECIARDLRTISQILSCVDFKELQVASPYFLFGPHIWRVPLIFLMETDDSVYVDLVRSMDGESVVPRHFFQIPAVSRLDSVHISPKLSGWSNGYAIPAYLTAKLDFISVTLSSGKMEYVVPVEISLASYKDLDPHCVDRLIEWFKRSTEISPPEVRLNITGRLNDIWRSAAENLHRLQPANSAIKLDDQRLIDKYIIRTQDARKDVIVDVYYNADRYKKELRQIRIFSAVSACSLENSCRHIVRYTIPPELLTDVLGFLERYDIDTCQATCRQLRGLADSLVLKLPLHCIQAEFSTSFLDGSHIKRFDPILSDSKGLHTCSGRIHETTVIGHHSLPSGQYIECFPPFSCHVRQATMGAEIGLLKRESPYSCDFDIKLFVIRDIRFANGVVQSERASMQNVLRLTRNSVAFNVWLSPPTPDRRFIATNSFFAAWRLELEKADIRNKFVVDKLYLDFPVISASNAIQVAHFLTDVVDVRQLISQCDLALYEQHFASDLVALSMWAKLSRQKAPVE